MLARRTLLAISLTACAGLLPASWPAPPEPSVGVLLSFEHEAAASRLSSDTNATALNDGEVLPFVNMDCDEMARMARGMSSEDWLFEARLSPSEVAALQQIGRAESHAPDP